MRLANIEICLVIISFVRILYQQKHNYLNDNLFVWTLILSKEMYHWYGSSSVVLNCFDVLGDKGLAQYLITKLDQVRGLTKGENVWYGVD